MATTTDRNRKKVEAYADFVGSAEELAAAAVECGMVLGWTSLDAEKTNERLVRYYVAEGVIDRPDRIGRDAMYQFRHLLQLLTARRMQENGTALAMIGPYNLRMTTQQLLTNLVKPAPTAAELLVQSFAGAVATPAREEALHRRSRSMPPDDLSAAPANMRASARANAPRPPVPEPDLAAEVAQLREEFKRGMQMIEELSAQLVELAEVLRRLAELEESRDSNRK
jgi:DNA-binding transcriptional MerR regulator